MVTFPTYQRRQTIQGGQTASYASSAGFTAPARAMQGFGDAVAGLGNEIAAVERKIQSTQDDSWFSKARAETAMRSAEIDKQQREAATGDAAGYQESVLGEFENLRNSYLESAPTPEAKSMYEQWSNGYKVSVYGDTAKFRAASELAQREDNLQQAMLAHSQTVFDNPSSYEEVRRRALDDLEGAKQWMTPEQEIAARQKVDRELQISRARSEIIRNPGGFQKSIGIGGTYDGAKDLLRNKEGFRSEPYWDVNAYRVGYGSDTVTTEDGTVKKVVPGMKITKADAERDLDRRVREFEKTAVNQVGADAWAVLPSSSRAALLSVTYNYGSLPDGVVSAVKTGDREKIANAVSGLQGHNDGVNRARRLSEAALIRSGKSDAPSFGDNPQYASLSPSDLIGLYQESETALASQERAAKAARTAELADIKGRFQLGLATGDTSVTPQAILSSELAPDDKAQLVNAWNAQNKDAITAAKYANAISSGEKLDVFSNDDRKGVGLVYDAAAKGASIYDDDGRANNLAQMIYSHSGIVPERAANEIRGGLVSGDPARTAAAASIAANLADENPKALSANPNGDDLAKAAQTYRHMTGTLGLTPEEAGKRMVDMQNPEKQKQREALLETKAVKDTLKDIGETDIRDLWDTPGPNFISGYDVGATDAAKSVMVSDYRSMLEESIVEAAGDMDLAKQFASDKFKRIYGPSGASLSGKGVITYLPPENFYPAGPDGSHGYITSQLISELGAQGIEGVTEVYLQTSDATIADFNAGRKPEYEVYYVQDGSIKQFPGTFRPEPPSPSQMDISSNVSAFESNRQQEMQRQQIIDSYGRGPNPLTEMQNVSVQ